MDALILRGGLHLRAGRIEAGWRDLDVAVQLEPAVRGAAGVERLRWGIEHGSLEWTRRAVDDLLADPRASVRVDTLAALVEAAYRDWGAAETADVLAAVDSSDWERNGRGRVTLTRARFLDEAGDTARAVDMALEVSEGLGGSAAQARLLVAEWRSERARDLTEVYALRRLLLPSASDSLVAERLAAIDELEGLVGLGLDRPLAWFAAAELARDRLSAPLLARGLFLAYGDQTPTDPWVPKALLAALDASPEEGDRAWILGRLETYPDSPYVLAAHGGSPAGLAKLEEELELRLRELIRE